LLRLGNFRLDFAPIRLNGIEATPALQDAIAGPKIIQYQKYPQADGGIKTELERVALSLPLLQNFFMEKV
jgi:hypothetical protein